MGQLSIDLPALIGSRICHDLISPIGVINNGLELLQMAGTGAAPGPELALIGQSVESASARIRFFRIAFGAAGDQTMGQNEVTSILRDLYAASRVEVDWQVTSSQSRNSVRMAFLALLCIETALHHGGRITIAEGAGHWSLLAEADKIAIDPELWALLTQPGPDRPLQPAQVQFALLPILAEAQGKEITLDNSDTALTLSF
ncbi:MULTISPECIES: histidine phosphotransferase family protein [unclassified Sulfitobacter]|uniref:histidine phosphotransferase family protein n=1 Tax=unclassified Sulfitobacter TaxID=196795 RepID=UPI0023E1AD48|nr:MULTISPECIES: histidine phosphotransferase family protein [unclassified Sulfitobacter]MDF3384173.1 histidine phosphotransferase [Sulfitobacter sp. Ks11]MDF3387591.1 histidine phosphotransferase [Sulfitobacter sp. M85]MDF3391011.1 histidine phosphotransferase [Sulfitobacter sp. Ks16]MDF3401649.1 histidine phosphotransferase [Sulfitobacter sp. KE39]MDF3405070.1 histidine phosphotransferase [Sulfitobacter sp. Ks35]